MNLCKSVQSAAVVVVVRRAPAYQNMQPSVVAAVCRAICTGCGVWVAFVVFDAHSILKTDGSWSGHRPWGSDAVDRAMPMLK
jgi:hypothetical protein